MKKIQKIFLSLALTLCLLVVPFGVSASAETAPFNLMPTGDSGYTIVAGDGTVTIENGVLTIVNNSDGDFRLTIDNTTPFDLSDLNTLHMQFDADMPFKMAYHIISDADATNDWLTTSTDYLDIYEIDFAADRAKAGEYDVNMNLSDLAVAITDKSSAHFDQFIILITGKGTFTLNVVEMIAVEGDEPVVDDPVADDPATDDPATDDPSTDTPTTNAPESGNTTAPETAATTQDSAQNDASDSNVWLIIIIVACVVVVVCVIAVIVILKRRKG